MSFDYDLKSNLVPMISNHSQSQSKLQLDKETGLMFTTDLVILYNRNIFKTSLYIYFFQDEKCRLMRNLSLSMVFTVVLLDPKFSEKIRLFLKWWFWISVTSFSCYMTKICFLFIKGTVGVFFKGTVSVFFKGTVGVFFKGTVAYSLKGL